MGITSKIIVLSCLAILLAAGIAFGIYKKTGRLSIFAQGPEDIFFPDECVVTTQLSTEPTNETTVSEETSIPQASGVEEGKTSFPKISWLIIAPLIIAVLFLYVAKKVYG